MSWKILDFLDSWAVIKLLSSDSKLVFISMSASHWHMSKQKVYDWPRNESKLPPHHNRLASSQPSHTIRKSIRPENHNHSPTTVIHLWRTSDGSVMLCDRLVSDLQPGHDHLQLLVAKVCMRWKFQEWLASDLRACRMTDEVIDWITTNLQRLATKGGPSCESGHSLVKLTSSPTVFDG